MLMFAKSFIISDKIVFSELVFSAVLTVLYTGYAITSLLPTTFEDLSKINIIILDESRQSCYC